MPTTATHNAPHYGDYKYLKFILSALFLPFHNTIGTAYYPQVHLFTDEMISQEQNEKEKKEQQQQQPRPALLPHVLLAPVAAQNTEGGSWVENMTMACPSYIDGEGGEMKAADIRHGLRFIRSAMYNTFDSQHRWLNYCADVHHHQFNLVLLDHLLQLNILKMGVVDGEDDNDKQTIKLGEEKKKQHRHHNIDPRAGSFYTPEPREHVRFDSDEKKDLYQCIFNSLSLTFTQDYANMLNIPQYAHHTKRIVQQLLADRDAFLKHMEEEKQAKEKTPSANDVVGTDGF